MGEWRFRSVERPRFDRLSLSSSMESFAALTTPLWLSAYYSNGKDQCRVQDAQELSRQADPLRALAKTTRISFCSRKSAYRHPAECATSNYAPPGCLAIVSPNGQDVL